MYNMIKKLVIYCLFLILISNEILCTRPIVECGYKQCPHTKEGTLNVHIIPHSHMDAGWVKTFDQYYYGTKASVSSANVQLIYHSVISELLHDKRRKFTFSETAFFWRWWKEQRPNTRATFRSLVEEGRIEFAGGGWTHADSATVSYLQLLDLWTWGLRKLNDTLGPCGKPKAAWQIDSYGHSRELASLLAQMGFDGLFLGRIDFKDREFMMEEDRMEFMWRGSDVLGKMSDIMSHAMFNLYNAPNGFCFDWLCADEPIIDDRDSPAYNAHDRVTEFIEQVEKQAKHYDHDNILVTMGGDFTYQNAANWFMNIDKLINHVNTHPANLSDINIFYSTPSCYLKAIYLYGRRDKALFTEREDHLPYGSDASTYWTGFYTSRPSLKYFTKRAHAFLQVVKQLSVITRVGDSYELHLLRHAVSLILHHDGITGTSQQHVANDFLKILSEAVDVCTKKASNLLSFLTPSWAGSRRSKNTQQFVVCHQLNISQCRFVESQDSILLLVYNPLTVKAYHYVRLPSVAIHYSIRDYNDEEVEYQITPLPAPIINLPGRTSTTIQELWFEAENIPPVGYSAFYLTPIRDQLEENNYKRKAQSGDYTDASSSSMPVISNEYLKVSVDKTTGLLESIQHADGARIQITQNFFFYGQGRQTLQSGAYSFRPQKLRPVPVTNRIQYSIVQGPLVKEIRQRFTDWISQVIRVYRGEDMVELEWLVGPVPIGSDLGKEVVSIIKTNISNGGEFFTDSNGRQMMRRTCWNETSIQTQKLPVPACYYPVTSRICINSLNSTVAMCVLTDRSQGGTSYDEGEIELMVHRRLLTDDGFGLEETLNEEAFGEGLVVKGTHRIMFGNFKADDNLHLSEVMSDASRRWEMEPWLFLTAGDKVRKKWQSIRNKRYSALRPRGLPAYIHILTLEPWKAGSVLLRLENTLESNKGRLKAMEHLEDTKSHITVDLRKIFLQLKIRLVKETTLAANQWLEEARQMDWSTRYVYKGGDDGIFPDDLPDDEDSIKTRDERLDSGHYSDEESDYPLNHRNGKSPTKSSRHYERRRRSLNETYSISENKINGTNYQQTNLKPNQTAAKWSATTEKYRNSTVKTGSKVSRKPNVTFLNSKPKELKRDWQKEEWSTEEDYSYKTTQRPTKNRNNKKNREDIEDTEDVTKSIYEMYYKPSPRNPYRRKHIKNLRKKNIREDSEEIERVEKADRPRRMKKINRDISMSERPRTLEARKADGRYGVTENSRTEQGRLKMEKMMSMEPRSKMPQRNLKMEHKIDRVEQNTERKGVIPLERSRKEERQIKRKSDERVQQRNVKKEQRSEMEYKRAMEQDKEDLEADDDNAHSNEGTSPKNMKRRRNEAIVNHKKTNDDEWIDDEYDYYYDDDRRKSSRSKRALPKDEDRSASVEETNELEYIVTLRPTQIRTFVIWFEGSRKHGHT